VYPPFLEKNGVSFSKGIVRVIWRTGLYRGGRIRRRRYRGAGGK
jgi:hypothetical protein